MMAPQFLEIFAVAAAPCMASLGMLMGDRWEAGRPTRDYLRSIAVEPSHCPPCGKKLSALALIPVFGFLAQRGRCACANTKIPAILPFSEVAAFLFILALLPTYGAMTAAFLPGIAGAWAAARSDWRTREVHEVMSAFVFSSAFILIGMDGRIFEHLQAMATIALPILLVFGVYKALGRIPVIPFGDFILGGALGMTLLPDQLLTFTLSLAPACFLVRYFVGPADEAERALPMAPMMAAAWIAALVVPFRF